MSLQDDLEELESAEDFLNYFGLEFNQSVVHVNRLHILQRYNQYLEQAKGNLEDVTDEAAREIYKKLLARAYQDFVESDALTEKVFKVFHMHEPQETFVPLDQIFQPAQKPAPQEVFIPLDQILK
jgi:nitrogenase-stabilizing/protective protein